MKHQKIYSNKIRCNHCGDIIESMSVHDFKTCSCGTVSVDGGKSYLKRSFKNSPNDFEDLSDCVTIELSICPICEEEVSFGKNPDGTNHIFCCHCHLKFEGSEWNMSEEELADEWNSRATIESEQVVRGEWIDTQPDYHDGYYKNAHMCSNCQKYYTTDYEEMNFCPKCGADMRKEVA